MPADHHQTLNRDKEEQSNTRGQKPFPQNHKARGNIDQHHSNATQKIDDTSCHKGYRNYKNRKQGILITAIAPSVANLVLAFVCGRLLRHGLFGSSYYLQAFFSLMVQLNVSLAAYNLMPVTPMDCLKVLNAVLPANTYFSYLQYEKIVQMIFLLLLFFGYTSIVFGPIIRLLMALCLW